MIGGMQPRFILAMYERDGQPAEKILRNIIRCKFYWHSVRPYKTENLYEILEKEAQNIGKEETASAAHGKRGKGKTRRHA
jgi:hypothetical protein